MSKAARTPLAERRDLSGNAARNLKAWRTENRLSQAEFAEAVDRLGVPMNRSVLANIEGGRREHLTLEELAAFALVLNVSPTNLMLPSDDDSPPADPALREQGALAPVSAVPATENIAEGVRQWFYGSSMLPSAADVKGDEFAARQRDFLRKATERERRDNDERYWRHPIVTAMKQLTTFVRTATIGMDDPGSKMTAKTLAMGIESEGERVKSYACLLAGELRSPRRAEGDRL